MVDDRVPELTLQFITLGGIFFNCVLALRQVVTLLRSVVTLSAVTMMLWSVLVSARKASTTWTIDDAGSREASPVRAGNAAFASTADAIFADLFVDPVYCSQL